MNKFNITVFQKNYIICTVSSFFLSFGENILKISHICWWKESITHVIIVVIIVNNAWTNSTNCNCPKVIPILHDYGPAESKLMQLYYLFLSKGCQWNCFINSLCYLYQISSRNKLSILYKVYWYKLT